MKINEYEYYNNLANWSFKDINYVSEKVTARHTKINPKQIYKTLKIGGYLIYR